MGFFDRFKNKNNERGNDGKAENGEPKLLDGFYVNGKYINLLGARIIKTANGMDTYICDICETDREDDTMFFDMGRPIAFELPHGRTDLIKSLISLWYQQRSGRELGNMAYTFIGDIRPGQDGQLYYYNEPASRETMEALSVEDERLIELQRQKEEQRRALEAKRQEDKFRERLRIDAEQAKRQQWAMQEKQRRMQNPSFESISNSDYEYDLTNVEKGTILTIRGMKKYKDENGRYLYKAKIREVGGEDYTELFEPVGYDVCFTVPGRLIDMVNGNNPNSKIYIKQLQKLLSHSYGVLENNDVDSVIDLGGILPDGRIIKNNRGISQPLYSKILELGGSKSLDDLEREEQER